MILLTKGEELLLVQFHEAKGERVGAHVGDVLGEDAFDDLRARTPGVEFEGAVDSLLGHNLLGQEGEGGYTLTQQGYDYLYSGAGHRLGEG